jgi:hypothetical protein
LRAVIMPETRGRLSSRSITGSKQDQWKNLMDMQVYLGNVKGSIPFDQIIDNSFAEKAIKRLGA